MTTEDLMKLADVYARLNAQTTAPGAGDARQELLDALEALGREVERLQLEIVKRNQRALDGDKAKEVLIGALEREETLRAELAAIRAQESVAYCVYFPTEMRQEFCQDLDDLMEDLTNLAHEVTPLYASPAAKDAGLVADGLNRPEIVSYVARYGGMCRDCADENGICPNSGLACASNKGIEHVLKALDYGLKHGYIAASPKIGGV